MNEETNPTKSIYDIIQMSYNDEAVWVLENPNDGIKNLTQEEIDDLDIDELNELPIKNFKQCQFKDFRIILDLIEEGWKLQPSEFKNPESSTTKSIYDIIQISYKDEAVWVLENPYDGLKNLTQEEIDDLDIEELNELPIKNFKQCQFKDFRIILDLIKEGWELKPREDIE